MGAKIGCGDVPQFDLRGVSRPEESLKKALATVPQRVTEKERSERRKQANVKESYQVAPHSDISCQGQSYVAINRPEKLNNRGDPHLKPDVD